MVKIRKNNERGRFNHGWLDTYHTFSFGDYFDPEHRGFRTLRVINEDYVRLGQGFPTHSHRDMEIITLVLEGALEHKDSLGNTSVIKPGEVQRMTAGTGVTHSEFNPSQKEAVHLLQIWILPARKGLEPGYEQRALEPTEKDNPLRIVASPQGKNGSVKIHQDASLYSVRLRGKGTLTYELSPRRGAWIQVIQGDLDLNGHSLKQGDGAAAEDEQKLVFQSREGVKFLLFDLA